MTTTTQTTTAEAFTALAYEQRTANLLHYLDPLPVGHNEGPAVLELIRERLGLAVIPLQPGEPKNIDPLADVHGGGQEDTEDNQ